MPVRGHRNPLPAKGGRPTGIFGTPQKVDSTEGYNKSLRNYAHSGTGEKSKPSGSNKSLRHQKPKRRG